MRSFLLKLFILCLASRQLEATGGEDGSSHHGAQSHGSPGTVTFTVDYELAGDNTFDKAVVMFKENNNACVGEKVSGDHETKPRFTVNWADCDGVKTVEDLGHVQIRAEFTLHYPEGNRTRPIVKFVNLAHNKTPEQLRHFFAGGEATIKLRQYKPNMVFMNDDNASEHNIHENPKSEATGSSNSSTNHPGLSQFIVEHTDAYCTFEHASIIHNSIPSSKCKPNEEGPKFAIDWTNCGVQEASDLGAIQIAVRFLLKGGEGKKDWPIRNHVDFGKFIKNEEPEVLERIFNGEPVKIVFDHGKSDPDVIFVADQRKSDAPNTSEGHHGHGKSETRHENH